MNKYRRLFEIIAAILAILIMEIIHKYFFVEWEQIFKAVLGLILGKIVILEIIKEK